MKKGTSKELAKKQKAGIEAPAVLPAGKIGTSDILKILDWARAKRGLLDRPIKQQIALKPDAGVVARFKSNVPGGHGCQTEINRILRGCARHA